MNKSFRTLLFYALIILVPILLSSYLSVPATAKKDIVYSEFLNCLQQDQIESVRVVEQTVTGKLKNGTEFKVVIPEDPNLIRSLHERGINVEVKLAPQPSILSTLLTTAVPVLVVVAALFFIMQQTQGAGSKAMQFGRSRARLHTNDKKKVTFADVAGVDEAKEEVQEIVEFLKHPRKYLEIGARIPKGVLIFGYPGTGKTLLARAIAGEAGVPFFSISGSDFVEMFVGVGAARVRDLFEQAKKNAPCIVFVDEIDAVGRQRGAGYGGGHDEREQTLNQLLVEMDGFGVHEGIIVVAATNRPDILDPALLRRGRFDRQIVLDRPDIRGRKEILEVHTRGKPLDSDADLEILARRTPGFTGADLENLVNEAALLAARRGKKKVGMAELEEGIDRVIAGPERKSRLMSDREKRIVAFHESAHALVAKMLPNADPVHKVSVIPRGAALGYVLQLPMEDRYLVTKSEILDKITEMLGGRAAEDLVFGEVTTGAQDDLDRSTRLARKMICEFGMSDELGPLTFGSKQEQVFLGRDIIRERNYSEEIASAIDNEVRHIIDQCYRRVKSILGANREKLDALAEALLEREILEGKELEGLLNSIGTSSPPAGLGERGEDLQLEQ